MFRRKAQIPEEITVDIAEEKDRDIRRLASLLIKLEKMLKELEAEIAIHRESINSTYELIAKTIVARALKTGDREKIEKEAKKIATLIIKGFDYIATLKRVVVPAASKVPGYHQLIKLVTEILEDEDKLREIMSIIERATEIYRSTQEDTEYIRGQLKEISGLEGETGEITSSRRRIGISIREIVSNIVNWFKDMWNKIRSASDDVEDAIDTLGEIASKVEAVEPGLATASLRKKLTLAARYIRLAAKLLNDE